LAVKVMLVAQVAVAVHPSLLIVKIPCKTSLHLPAFEKRSINKLTAS
jgi:hypothetical protein